MDVIQSLRYLRSLDFIQLSTGEILTLYGNFDGPWYRARLSFYPDASAQRRIHGRPYQKVRYETGYTIPACEKLLNLPGEQHFLVHVTQIENVYHASDAFTHLTADMQYRCNRFIAFINEHCHCDRAAHGLTGSGALQCLLPTSDFDWVLYHDNPAKVAACVRASAECTPELTFAMEHVYQKYRVFQGLRQCDLDVLFANRWKYFRYQGLCISLSVVDPAIKADEYCCPYERAERVTLKGEVIEGTGSYHTPHCIPIRCNGEDQTVFSWLFLYSGAFTTGDRVEVTGRRCTVHGQQYILVEEPQDYIRKIIG